MSRLGRALRDQALVERLGSTPAAQREREIHQAAAAQLFREFSERYPDGGISNPRAALDWQEARLNQIKAELRGG